MNAEDRQRQMKQAEEVLGDRLDRIGFVKGLFFGQFLADALQPYPLDASPRSAELNVRLRAFCRERIDAASIDRQAEIPSDVVRGLGELGVLGACLPTTCGGLAYSQTEYCRLLETLGGHCGSTALFVNAHHSIGPRALVLFGADEQRRKYLPKLATGESISAFALTEPEAGSDAANVQTTATPTDDGRGYRLKGEKRWITNGGIADVLTVMARTPVDGSAETRITAFIVTPDMPGFEVVERRMEKCGVRGTATSRLAFHDMFVPRQNVLGPVGKGLRVALTVLDYGRTTFGASCTGAAKACLVAARRHANSRVQFGQTLGSFELVKKKLAAMQSAIYAMEACTYQTAALIDSGAGDFMLETAMLKVWSTDWLWTIVNDTFQIYGGKAYFTDEPYERMMRDARINMIGEGANDVLRAFVALVGMRDVGLELQGVLEAIRQPIGRLAHLGRFAGRKLSSALAPPIVPVSNAELEEDAAKLAQLIRRFGGEVEWLLRTHQESVVDRQYQLERIFDAATELYHCACVLHRLDRSLTSRHDSSHDHSDVHLAAGQEDESCPPREWEIATARHFLRGSARRLHAALGSLRDNDDDATTRLANYVLGR